jgi:hypothetical protein
VDVTPDEEEALQRGEMPPGVQAQISRQLAEDVAIAEMEREA